jgi:M6 family metalloprotease-like protein
MKKQLQILVLFVFSAFLLQTVKAAPAFPYPVQVTQPDGSVVTVIMRGDENAKWAQTTDGYTLLYNAKGIFEYAITDKQGDAVPSGIAFSDVNRRTQQEMDLLKSLPKGITFSQSQFDMLRSIQQIKNEEAIRQVAFPTTGNRKLVCILMGFKDKPFSKTQTDFNNLFNQVNYSTGGATGSVKDYYLQNSYGQFNLTVTVAGPYTAANNMSYYGGNDANGNDLRPRELVTEAVNAADPYVNYADFDNNNDGTVDGVYVIYAGYGEEAGGGTSAIWAHAWNITSIVRDGKTINRYSCSAELRGGSGTTITAIGVICHEFGHVLGAPDYYDTNYATGGQFNGTGNWDLMAGGSWNNNGVTPAHHNVYTKVKLYGWATAPVLTTAGQISVTNAAENASFYQINSTTTNEYWLIENRQKIGFDAFLPGNGLMIYHVHSTTATTTSNDLNATYPQKMYPVCASATTNPGSTSASYGSINSAGCPFPGSAAKTSFTDATTPHMKSWAGANTNKPITNIVENATTKTVTFSFMGGTSVQAPSASTLSATSVTTTSGVLNGSVNANGSTTTITFEYGTTTSYGYSANATPSSVSGTSLTNVSLSLSGLTSGTTYYYRVKAVNAAGTTYGAQQSFTTSSTTVTPPSATTLSATNLSSSAATLNGSVNANGYSTTVTFEYGTTSSYGSTAYATPSTVTGSNTTSVSVALTGLSANTTYYYRVKAVSSAGTTYGTQQTFTTPSGTVTYCASKGNSTTYEWIDLVQFAGINRTSGADGGYSDNTSMVGTVSRNSTVTMYISAGFRSTAYTEYWSVYIDFNQNGTFETSEKVVSGSSSSSATLSASVTIPSTATLGYTRMRVILSSSSSTTACNSYSYGETEDYTVNITSAGYAPESDKTNASKLGNSPEMGLDVYPNPATDKVTVRVNGIDGIVTLRIYDMRGAVVKTTQVSTLDTDIEISDLAKGVYIIAVDEDRAPVRKQFIKK